MKVLTERQKQVFEFIRKFRDEHAYPPTVRKVAEHFAISTKGAWDHMKALEKKGYLRQDLNRSRTLEILSDPDGKPRQEPTVRLPVLGEVAAGRPILADVLYDSHIEVPAYLTHGKTCFALHVRGDSMKNAGILNGDLAIIESIPDSDNGDIVVALVEDSVTIKRFFKENNRFRLQAENPEYPHIYTQDLRILGKLQGILRTY
jgi:repressor LexA